MENTITISKEGNNFEIDKDGDNQIMSEPVEMNEEPNNYEDVTSLSLEKDLEINLMKNLEQLEQGLSSPQSQVPFESGEVRSIIDILAKDKDGNSVFHIYGNSKYHDSSPVRTLCLMYVINPHAGYFHSVDKEKTAHLTIVPIHGQEIPKSEIKDMENILRESL